MEQRADVNTDQRDSCVNTHLFDLDTKEEAMLKEEEDSEEEEEGEVNSSDISRHAVVSDLELDELEMSRSEMNKLTRKQTLWAVTIFFGWLESQGLQIEPSRVEKTELNGMLRQFYGSVRTSKGEMYGISSYVSLRAGLNRYFKEPPLSRSICLIRDDEFTSSNKVFLAMLNRIRKSGKDRAQHHPALSPDDIRILRHSRVMDSRTPKGLLNKIWFDIQIYFGHRGKQANRNLKPDSFIIRQDEKGLKYCTLSFIEETKFHNKKDQCYMYEKPGNEFCPVTSLIKYLRKLPSNAVALYLQPKREITSDVWYNNTPLGVNCLGTMLSRMSREARTSIIYTNHCIRTTPFNLLCNAGLEGRVVLPVVMGRVAKPPEREPTPSTVSSKKRRKILPKSGSAVTAGLQQDNRTLRSSTHSLHHHNPELLYFVRTYNHDHIDQNRGHNAILCVNFK